MPGGYYPARFRSTYLLVGTFYYINERIVPSFGQSSIIILKMSMNMVEIEDYKKQYLAVLKRLSEIDHFRHVLQGHCKYEHPTEEEREILFRFQNEGIVKLLNVSWLERPTGIVRAVGDAYHLHDGIEFELIQPDFKEYLRDFEVDYARPKAGDYFGFDDGTFWVKRADGKVESISFNPKPGETSNTFLLCYSLVKALQVSGIWNGDWLETHVSSQQIQDFIRRSRYVKVDVTSDWLKNTKGNFIQKLTPNIKDFVRLGVFDRSEGGYPFRIKIPH